MGHEWVLRAVLPGLLKGRRVYNKMMGEYITPTPRFTSAHSNSKYKDHQGASAVGCYYSGLSTLIVELSHNYSRSQHQVSNSWFSNSSEVHNLTKAASHMFPSVRGYDVISD